MSYTFVHTYIHIRQYVYTHLSIHTYTFLRTYLSIHIYIFVNTYIHIFRYMYTHFRWKILCTCVLQSFLTDSYIHVSKHTCICVSRPTYTCIRINILTYTYTIYTYTHTHIHMCTLHDRFMTCIYTHPSKTLTKAK